MTDQLQAAAEVLPLYRRSHQEYIVFCERASKVLLLGVEELDVQELEMAAARLESTMVALQSTVRRCWNAHRALTDGLAERAA